VGDRRLALVRRRLLAVYFAAGRRPVLRRFIIFEQLWTETRCVFWSSFYLRRVTEPLALLLSERGLIASQLTERLEGVRYRPAVINRPADLVSVAETQKAMVVLVDVEGLPVPTLAAIEQLRANQATSHIPVIAFAKEADGATQASLVAKGATIVVNEVAVLDHLAQLLDRALEIS